MIPRQFVREPLVSGPVSEKPCGVCGLPAGSHTGRVCALCRGPVEHHQATGSPSFTPTDFADCIAGAKRMAAARRDAGAELTDQDLDVLAYR